MSYNKLLESIKFNEFISPWVLPKENIPCHLIWDKDFNFDYVSISLPKDIILVETINVAQEKSESDHIIIKKTDIIKATKFQNFPNFFGLILRYENLDLPYLKMFIDIVIQFYGADNSLVLEKRFTAKIFSPILINRSKLEPKILQDNVTHYNTKIDLEYRGFGLIATHSEVKINQITFDIKTDIEQRIRQRILDLISRTSDESIKTITNAEVDAFFDEIEKFKASSEPQERGFSDLLRKSNANLNLFYLFIQELLEELHVRLQSQNVTLDAPLLKIPKEQFNIKVVSLELFVYYKDLQENIYQPVVVVIPIKDTRSKPQMTTIDFEIQINRIIDNRFEDIEKERRDEE